VVYAAVSEAVSEAEDAVAVPKIALQAIPTRVFHLVHGQKEAAL
jgi:hypothetical protein